MNMRTTILAVLAACGGAASAQGFMPWIDIMRGADADASGAVSMEEVEAYRLGSRFQGFQPWMSDHFADLDTDGDGEVSVAELEAGTRRMGMDGAALSRAWTEGLGFMPREQE